MGPASVSRRHRGLLETPPQGVTESLFRRYNSTNEQWPSGGAAGRSATLRIKRTAGLASWGPARLDEGDLLVGELADLLGVQISP